MINEEIELQVALSWVTAVMERYNMALYCATYLEKTYDEMKELGDRYDNTRHMIAIRNRIARVTRESRGLREYVEKLFAPGESVLWLDSYPSFEKALDDYFGNEAMYKETSLNDRAREISRAAKLRYHDPLETNTQRIFEEGFRWGAAYADLHPAGKLDPDSVKRIR